MQKTGLIASLSKGNSLQSEFGENFLSGGPYHVLKSTTLATISPFCEFFDLK
jgi:hypothetical protein